MKRLNRFENARMVSARVERSEVEKFEQLLSQQRYLTLQDFIAYAMTLYISGTIKAEGKDFVITQPPTDSHNV